MSENKKSGWEENEIFDVDSIIHKEGDPTTSEGWQKKLEAEQEKIRTLKK